MYMAINDRFRASVSRTCFPEPSTPRRTVGDVATHTQASRAIAALGAFLNYDRMLVWGTRITQTRCDLFTRGNQIFSRDVVMCAIVALPCGLCLYLSTQERHPFQI